MHELHDCSPPLYIINKTHVLVAICNRTKVKCKCSCHYVHQNKSLLLPTQPLFFRNAFKHPRTCWEVSLNIEILVSFLGSHINQWSADKVFGLVSGSKFKTNTYPNQKVVSDSKHTSKNQKMYSTLFWSTEAVSNLRHTSKNQKMCSALLWSIEVVSDSRHTSKNQKICSTLLWLTEAASDTHDMPISPWRDNLQWNKDHECIY